MSELFVSIMLILGSTFIFIGALGILKFSDPLMGAHALSKAMTLGISLVLLALVPSVVTYAEGIKIFLAITFLFLTIPIAGHTFALYLLKAKD